MIVSKTKTIIKKNIVIFVTSVVICGGGFSASGCLKRNPPSAKQVHEEVDPKKTQRSAEVLREVMEVVFGNGMFLKTLDRQMFGDWADSLNQGMSLEGVYRGMVYGAQYRALERATAASENCVRQFEALSGKKAETVVELEMASERPTVSGASEISFSKRAKGNGEKRTSAYALKRVAGEELLNQFEMHRSEGKSRWAQWYAAWAVAMLHHRVSFGLEVRNRDDVGFHRRWAEDLWNRGDLGLDRVRWEVLTRVHRVLNSACGI